MVADFTNQTGDPVFDDALRQGLSFELEQSPFYRDSGPEGPADAGADGPVERRAGDAGHRAANLRANRKRDVLEGSIASLGSQYVLGLRAKNCRTGSILDQQQVQAATERRRPERAQPDRPSDSEPGPANRWPQLKSMRRRCPKRRPVNRSLESLQHRTEDSHVLRPFRGNTLFPAGRRNRSRIRDGARHPGASYSSNGESVLSAESTMKAWQLRDRVSDREKFFIDFVYDRQVTGNLEKAYQTLKLWLQTYPRGGSAKSPWFIRGHFHPWDRPIRKSDRRIAQRDREGSRRAMAYGDLAWSYFLTGRFPEAERTVQRPPSASWKSPRLLVIRYNFAVLKGDREQMDRAVALAKGKRGGTLDGSRAGSRLARSGRLQAARRSSNQAMDLALQEGKREAAASYQAARAVWEAVSGNAAEAKRDADGGARTFEGPGCRIRRRPCPGSFGRLFSIRGARRRFRKAVSGRYVCQIYLCAGSSRVSRTERGKPADSVERLQIALPYELAANGLNFSH